MRIPFVVVLAFLVVTPAVAQQQVPSRVEVAWNRFYDYEEMTGILESLAEAYPELLALDTIGRSEEGREIWLVTLNNPATGADTEKPAMWIDGNVHGNEIQATETVLYSIWYLAKSYGEVDALTELVDRCAFYFVPSVNPDGRDGWFHDPSAVMSSRSGRRPTDNDHDGSFDEDGSDDLNGDGVIGRMYRFDPSGRMRRSPDDPNRIVPAAPGEDGELTMVGSEGIDNDGDGRINEDGPGGYDMNRNWPSAWQPSYIQSGAGDYPFDRPETRAIGEFILEHPNIAAGQSYHNAGGMILRGPGSAHRDDWYDATDRAMYDRIASVGEEILPFYRSMVVHSDLYPAHGSFVSWLSEGLGIASFTNELWTGARRNPQDGRSMSTEDWQDRVLFGQTEVAYEEFDHPTLGRILIGGRTKWAGRLPPPFMLEEECHRNFAFTMYHADQMPRVELSLVEVTRLGSAVWAVTVELENDRIIPTRLSIARRQGIGRPDRVTLTGSGVTVVASGRVDDHFDTTLDPVPHRPQEILVDEGIPGQGRRTFRFVVAGRGGDPVNVRFESEKARDIQTVIVLEERE